MSRLTMLAEHLEGLLHDTATVVEPGELAALATVMASIQKYYTLRLVAQVIAYDGDARKLRELQRVLSDTHAGSMGERASDGEPERSGGTTVSPKVKKSPPLLKEGVFAGLTNFAGVRCDGCGRKAKVYAAKEEVPSWPLVDMCGECATQCVPGPEPKPEPVLAARRFRRSVHSVAEAQAQGYDVTGVPEVRLSLDPHTPLVEEIGMHVTAHTPENADAPRGVAVEVNPYRGDFQSSVRIVKNGSKKRPTNKENTRQEKHAKEAARHQRNLPA